jgi:tetratricopeptide (TPR) repeat protein
VIGEGQFAGREAELASLSLMLRETRAADAAMISVIGGTAGVGKTALAVHWARQIAADFPDGQLYVNLRGFDPAHAPADPAEAVSGFLKVLGTPPQQMPATLEAQAALYRTLLAGRRMLLILDNASDEEQVRPLLPAVPGTLVIVTSRNQLAGLAAEGARPLTLDVLAEAEADELLARLLGAARSAAEPQAVAELASLCARLPLALTIVAAQARSRPHLALTALASELRDSTGRLTALDAGDPGASVRAVFSLSWQHLSPSAAEMFRLLGLHPGPDISAAAAASLAEVSLPRARELLGELAHGHLLTEHAPGRYAFHDLLRAYAAELAAAMDAPARHVVAARMLGHYLHTAHSAALLVNPMREPIVLTPAVPGVMPEQVGDRRQALAWFEAERQVLLSAITQASDAGFDIHAWQLTWAMNDFLDWRGDWLDWAAVNRVALAAAIRAGDIPGQAVTSRLVALTLGRVGDYEQARAYLTDCLAMCRRVGARALEARVFLSLSWVSAQEGNNFDALGLAEQALTLFRAIGDQAGEALSLNNVGYAHLVLGDRRLARTFCEQALAVFQGNHNAHGEAVAWESLGDCESQLGRHADAAECYQRSISLFRDIGDRYREARVLTYLGDSHNAEGDPGQAEDFWRQALAILDDLQHSTAERVRRRLSQQ